MPSEDVWTDELGFTDLGSDERERKLEQIKRLIRELPDRHPGIFEDEPVSTDDYRSELNEAVFSLGRILRQEHGASNEEIVTEQFLEPASVEQLLTYDDQSGAERIDFKGELDDGTRWAMDVKGGEGQSIGHLLVPSNTEFLVVWSERNARNTKPPAGRLNEVINRVVRWGFNQDQDVAMMVIRDPPAGARTEDGAVIPDVVVFPEQFPTPEDPDPSLRELDDLRFAEVLYRTLVDENDLRTEVVQKHIWYHDLTLTDANDREVSKSIFNAYDERIRLPTRDIDYSRISNV